MKKVVAISIFGDGDKYTRYFRAFLQAHLNLFQITDGWRLRVYADNKVTKTETGIDLVRFANDGLIDAVYMGPAIRCKAMLWRIAPVFDEGAEYVFCRDLDCVPMPRDRAVMEQFIASKATVHTVHDNTLHRGIMGGLCGFHAPSFKETTGFQSLAQVYAVAPWANWEIHGMDQNVLNLICLREGGQVLLEHRYNGWYNGPGTTGVVHKAGTYLCQAYSTPVPDVGVSPLSADLATKADRLAAHLGAPGFDHVAAKAFYDTHGDKMIAEALS